MFLSINNISNINPKTRNNSSLASAPTIYTTLYLQGSCSLCT